MSESASVLLHRLLARGKFRHIEVLLKVAELGSVQRAAEAIGVTQSSVTQTLAYLETLLGAPLFQRLARGMRPTPAGAELLPVARQLMGGLADAAAALAAHRRSGGGSLRLVASATAINGLLLDALPGFHARHPAIEVQLHQAEGDDQLLAIGRGEADLVACRQPAVVPQGWAFLPLADDRYGVVCDPAHPLAAAPRLTFDALADQTWLAAPAGTAVRETLDRLTAHWPGGARLHPLVTRLLRPMEALLGGTRLLSLMPQAFVAPLRREGRLAVLALDAALPPLPPLGLLQPERALRPAAEALSRFLQARAAA